MNGFQFLNLILLLAVCHCFQMYNGRLSRSRFVLQASKNSDDEGYDIIGTLSRQGPVPALIRIFNSEKYNASVQKYMNKEKCSRIEAMANMDAYFQDPTGWIITKKRDEKSGTKTDFVNAFQDPTSLALTLVWGLFSSALLLRIAYGFLERIPKF